MKKISVTPVEEATLNALCELGQTDLVARRTKVATRTVEVRISRMLKKLGYPNRLTLALAWDRQTRN